MKVAVLASKKLGREIIRLAKKNDFDIDISLLIYEDYKDSVDILKTNESKYDGIIFAGAAAYSYSKLYITPTAIWDYLPTHECSLANALLYALYLGYDIRNISTDLYSQDDFKEVFRVLHINWEQVNINTLNLDIYDKNCNEISYDFHKKNHKKNKNICIITAFNTTHNLLLKENILNFISIPTESVVKDIFQKIILKYNANINKKSQVVIGYVKINFPNEYSIINMHDYYYMKEKNKISEMVYSFAQDIKAAVTEVSFNTYQIVSTRNILEMATNNFRDFEILNSASKNSLHTLAIGFGYGKTADEAKINANLATMKSEKTGENCAYVIYENKDVIGPIKAQKQEKENQIDSKILDISEKCNIGMKKIFDIYNAIDKYQKDSFTSSEIAKICNLSIRSTNKLLLKLENHGYTEIVGKKFSDGSGRPSRIIKFKF